MIALQIQPCPEKHKRPNSQKNHGEECLTGLKWVPGKKHASTVAEELLSLHLNLCLICARGKREKTYLDHRLAIM